MIKRYSMRLKKWAKYAKGSSYQHKPQGIGDSFEPGALLGYFNDLTCKASFSGRTNNGIPIVATDTVDSFEFPIVIFQWGLGNWDLWLSSKKTDDIAYNNFLKASKWAIENQDENGGWSCWHHLSRPTINNFSAMAQGEGISLLCRAYSLSEDYNTLSAARSALRFMLDHNSFHLKRNWGSFSSLEEYPGESLPGVLNGWCFAISGVYDFSLVDDEFVSTAILDELSQDLAEALPRYDNGFWSNYDLAGNIASPFYHDLHISQLRALALMFPSCSSTFLKYADIFEEYSTSNFSRFRAVSRKIIQKIGQTSIGEMRE